MLSFTEENYIKTIYKLNDSYTQKASTNAIAEALNTKASSVSDMLKKLKEKGFINYQKYQAVSLSPSGNKVAIAVIRKHRLWEYFLVNKLHFGWEEVHEVAEQLEHIQSSKLTLELDKFLGYPEFDPHGDPIPNKDGKFPAKLNLCLNQIKTGQTASVLGVRDHSTLFLTFLENLSIKLGSKIKLIAINDFDQSLSISLLNKEFTISNEVAKNLYVEIC